MENEIKIISQRTGFTIDQIKEFNSIMKFNAIELNRALAVYMNAGAFDLTDVIKAMKLS